MIRKKSGVVPRRWVRRTSSVIVWLAPAWWSAGCVLGPADGALRERLARAGAPYAAERARRVVPELPARTDWRALVKHALRVNGEVEAAFFEWQAAAARVGVMAAWPNTNLFVTPVAPVVGASVADAGNVTIGFDPMQNLALLPKAAAAGRVARAEAEAAGARFRAACQALRERVLAAAADVVLATERVRLQREHADILRFAAAAAAARLRAGGGSRQALLVAERARAEAENELRSGEAALREATAALNALLGRPALAPLDATAIFPPGGRPAPVTDELAWIRALAERSPQLAARRHEVESRVAALRLARLQFLPDVNPLAMLGGGPMLALGAGVSIPATLPRVRSAVAEARAALRAAEALLEQTERDLAARVAAALVALQDAERQAAVITGTLAPLSRAVTAAAAARYGAGTADLDEVVDARRTELTVALAATEARTARERSLALLETLTGVGGATPGGLTGGEDVARAEEGRHAP